VSRDITHDLSPDQSGSLPLGAVVEDGQRLLFDTLLDGVLLADKEGRIVDWNRGAEQLFGYRRDEILGERASVLRDPAFGAQLEADVRDTLQRKGRWEGEGPFRRADGALGVAHAVVVAQRDRSGAIIGYLGVSRDVTARRALEEQLARTRRLESVGQLAGVLAHDFNNALTVIRSYGELVRESLSDRDPLRDDMQEIISAAVRAASLTRQLLALSRRELVTPRVLDVNEVVRDMAPLLDRLAGERIELTTVLATQPARVLADRGQLEQVMMNLAVNAREAMPNGGVLAVEISERALDAATARALRAPAPGPHVVISISDNGVGMDDQVKARMFEPFFTTKAIGEGSGLGLVTVQSIVTQAGGVVRVESSTNAGTTIEVLLPRADDSLAPTAVAPAATTSPGAREPMQERADT
jgi:PAS domain S-box-containing protein